MQTKTRSDYHDLQGSHPYSISYFGRWVKPLLFLVIGFIFGTFYNKPAPEEPDKPLLMSEQKHPATTLPIDKKHHKEKGRAASSKA